MRKVKNAKVGEYALVAKYSDKDLQDPWAIGFITEWGEDRKGMWYKVTCSDYTYRNCWRITDDDEEAMTQRVRDYNYDCEGRGWTGIIDWEFHKEGGDGT